MKKLRKSKELKEILTVEHPKWPEFARRLEKEVDVANLGRGRFRSNCDSTNRRPLARKLLGKMGFDVEKALEYFDGNGGHCDCEILWNVDVKRRRRG
ncbi:MAG: DUF2695 domain-containing protein [Desulfobacterales bacterium]|nr:DUF2695 domain-containing protein [Desulfobacterales bacterium]